MSNNEKNYDLAEIADKSIKGLEVTQEEQKLIDEANDRALCNLGMWAQRKAKELKDAECEPMRTIPLINEFEKLNKNQQSWITNIELPHLRQMMEIERKINPLGFEGWVRSQIDKFTKDMQNIVVWNNSATNGMSEIDSYYDNRCKVYVLCEMWIKELDDTIMRFEAQNKPSDATKCNLPNGVRGNEKKGRKRDKELEQKKEIILKSIMAEAERIPKQRYEKLSWGSKEVNVMIAEKRDGMWHLNLETEVAVRFINTLNKVLKLWKSEDRQNNTDWSWVDRYFDNAPKSSDGGKRRLKDYEVEIILEAFGIAEMYHCKVYEEIGEIKVEYTGKKKRKNDC